MGPRVPWLFNKIRRCFPRGPLWAIGGAGVLVFGLIPRAPWPSLREGIPSSQAVYDRNGRLLRFSLSDDEKYRLWLPLEEIPPAFIEATLLKEDRWFYFHPGVNPWSLARAFWATYVRGGKRIGGSTLTMQLARLKSGSPSRTAAGKIFQILRAVHLEITHTKREILEAYLNLAPYGGNVEGVAAAGLIYFGKDVEALDLPEMVALAVIPQNPGGPRGVFLRGAQNRLWDLWLKKHPGDREKLQHYNMDLVFSSKEDLPFRAPHFVQTVMREHPRSPRLRTTLDAVLQRIVENQITAHVLQNREIGVRNAAALLLDAGTMEVVAEVGSADFFNAGIQGQVNGTRSRRSPGSTLKPFLYALAMDQGLIHAMSVLKDAPFGYGGFNPENFDGDFDGPVTVHDALIRSRNIPAVQTALDLKSPDFYDFLIQAGVDLPRPRDYYGAGLVLGGMEVTMRDLVRLYAVLANEGELRPLKNLLSPPEEGTRILSREACFILLDILKDNPPPGVHYKRDWLKKDLPVHWKTGTSFAYKDAWAVGVFGPYVLAVWVGNFDGLGNPAFVGARAAAPLFFRIVESVKAQNPSIAPLPGGGALNVQREKVCAVSGGFPNGLCPMERGTWFIPGVSPIQKCNIHRRATVRKKSGLRVCVSEGAKMGDSVSRVVSGEGGVEHRIYEFWPSDLLKIFRGTGIPRQTPPPFEPGCAEEDQGAFGLPPKITSPQKGVVYHHRLNPGLQDGISLTAATDADARELTWFANKTFLGRIGRDTPLLWRPTPGDYVLRVVDDQGRSDTLALSIRAVQ